MLLASLENFFELFNIAEVIWNMLGHTVRTLDPDTHFIQN